MHRQLTDHTYRPHPFFFKTASRATTSPFWTSTGGTNVRQDLPMAVKTLSGGLEFAEAKHALGKSSDNAMRTNT